MKRNYLTALLLAQLVLGCFLTSCNDDNKNNTEMSNSVTEISEISVISQNSECVSEATEESSVESFVEISEEPSVENPEEPSVENPEEPSEESSEEPSEESSEEPSEESHEEQSEESSEELSEESSEVEYTETFTEDAIFEMNDDGRSYSLLIFGCIDNVKELIIPSEHDGLPVTAISGMAFESSSINTIHIPSTIEKIYFDSCEQQSLKRFEVESGNSFFTSVDGILFSRDMTKLIKFPSGNGKTAYTLPNTVKEIASYAFSNCHSLKSITFNDYLESIRDEAFYNCSKLLNVSIPESVNYIGDNAFFGCHAMTEIKLPFIGNAPDMPSPFIYIFTSLGSDSDEVPHSLRKVTVSGGRIIENAFYMYGLTDIVLMPDVCSIEPHAFEGCTNLKNVTVSSSLTEIGEYAFRSCRSLENVKLPDGITKISEGMFTDCESLKHITIPDSVTEISSRAFRLTCLESIDFGSGIRYIGNAAFLGAKFKELVIPNTVEEIGDHAFYECREMKTIYIPESVTKMGDRVFYDCRVLEIHCAASSKPDEWNVYWNRNSLNPDAISNDRPVIWGYGK